MKKIILLIAAAALAASSASAQKLVIKGSDTLGAKLVPTLKEAYVAKNPGVSGKARNSSDSWCSCMTNPAASSCRT